MKELRTDDETYSNDLASTEVGETFLIDGIEMIKLDECYICRADRKIITGE